MREILEPNVNLNGFLRTATDKSYSMMEGLVKPAVADSISTELKNNGYLVDYTELVETENFMLNGMRTAYSLYQTLNHAVCDVTGMTDLYFPYFSVRVFKPGEHATTIHRNHPCIGPWAVGITLKGEAPFSVYQQDLLPESWNQTIPLKGDASDPPPQESMKAAAGAAWTLYTATEQKPHSGGLVNSNSQRELLILYGMQG